MAELPSQDAARLTLQSLARLSKGVQIGLEQGFNSWAYVDYIYANRAFGTTPFGALVDRLFLSHPACAALRSRCALTAQQVQLAVESFSRPTVVDLAAGTAPYLFALPRGQGEFIAGDVDPAAVKQGNQLAGERGRDDIRFIELNAFNRRSLPDCTADVVVTSGFFGFLPEPAVRRVFHACSGLTRAGSRWVFNVQHQHPGLLEGPAESPLRALLGFFTNPSDLKSAEKVAGWAAEFGWSLERSASNDYFSVASLVRER